MTDDYTGTEPFYALLLLPRKANESETLQVSEKRAFQPGSKPLKPPDAINYRKMQDSINLPSNITLRGSFSHPSHDFQPQQGVFLCLPALMTPDSTTFGCSFTCLGWI